MSTVLCVCVCVCVTRGETGRVARMSDSPGNFYKCGDIVGFSICENGVLCLYKNYELVQRGIITGSLIYSGFQYDGRYKDPTGEMTAHFNDEWYGIIGVSFLTSKVTLTDLNSSHYGMFACC